VAGCAGGDAAAFIAFLNEICGCRYRLRVNVGRDWRRRGEFREISGRFGKLVFCDLGDDPGHLTAVIFPPSCAEVAELLFYIGGLLARKTRELAHAAYAVIAVTQAAHFLRRTVMADAAGQNVRTPRQKKRCQ
jgi:hypothetical protein